MILDQIVSGIPAEEHIQIAIVIGNDFIIRSIECLLSIVPGELAGIDTVDFQVIIDIRKIPVSTDTI